MAIWAKDKHMKRAAEAKVAETKIDAVFREAFRIGGRWPSEAFGKCVFCKRVFTSCSEEFRDKPSYYPREYLISLRCGVCQAQFEQESAARNKKYMERIESLNTEAQRLYLELSRLDSQRAEKILEEYSGDTSLAGCEILVNELSRAIKFYDPDSTIFGNSDAKEILERAHSESM